MNNLAYDRDLYAEEMKKKRKMIFDTVKVTCGKVVNDEENFRQYMKLQAMFDRFSVINVMLLLAQKQEVNVLKTFDQWKRDRVRINRGEKGVKLILPRVMTDDEGRKYTAWSLQTYFDISQTSMKDDRYLYEPEPVDYRDMKNALMNAVEVPFDSRNEIPGDTAAYYDPDREIIFMKNEFTESDMKDLLTEAALHEMHMNALEEEKPFDREKMADEARMISHMLCLRYDIPGYEHVNIPENFRQQDELKIRALLAENKKTMKQLDRKITRYLYKDLEPEMGER